MTQLIPTPAPRIARFENLAYGMFIHWGLYAQLGRGEWIMHQEKIPAAEYAKLKDTFTASDFDARVFARTAKAAGMKYITLTTRHHEGFSLYDTRGLDDFDAPHSPAGRDLIAEFVAACREEDLIPFFYHTTLDWRWDSAHCSQEKFDEYLDYLHASVEVLCRNYGEIGGLWFDGNWSRQGDWKEDRLYGLIRKYQPEAMIINNTGLGAEGALGHPELDSATFEQGLPVAPDRRGWAKYVAGEMCQTFNSHWGIGARDFDYMSPGKVIENLAACRKVGANYLLNVGPTATGGMPAYEKATLERVGQWVELVGETLYRGKPSGIKATGRDFVLRHDDALYYFAYNLAREGDSHVTVAGGGAGPRVISGLHEQIQSAAWLDSGKEIEFAHDAGTGLGALELSGYPYGTNLVVRVAKISL